MTVFMKENAQALVSLQKSKQNPRQQHPCQSELLSTFVHGHATLPVAGSRSAHMQIHHPWPRSSVHLDEESSELVTMNTYQDLCHYLCLPLGVASALAVFQKTTDTILQRVPDVICYR